MKITAMALDVQGVGPVEKALRDAPPSDLLVLPEAALGPFPSGRDADLDRRSAVTVPGDETAALGRLAAGRGVWLAIGLVERDGDALFDSAVLFDPSGTLVLHYRRNHPGWFYPDADRSVYRCGDTIPVIETPCGRTAFAICGDLFDDGVVERLRVLDLDLLLVPLARSLEDGPDAWPEEIPFYEERVARIGVPTVIVNRSDGNFVGGMLALDGEGRVRSRSDGRGVSTYELP